MAKYVKILLTKLEEQIEQKISMKMIYDIGEVYKQQNIDL
jgi:hypothetical protein